MDKQQWLNDVMVNELESWLQRPLSNNEKEKIIWLAGLGEDKVSVFLSLFKELKHGGEG